MATPDNEYEVSIIQKDFSVKTFQVPGASLGTQVEYPSQWFRTNPRKKPPVKIPKHPTDQGALLRLIGSYQDGAEDYRLALIHVYTYMARNITETLQSRWTSYGVTIGEEKTEITPASLLDVQVLTEDWPSREGPEPTDADLMLLFIKCLMGYRYGLAADAFSGDYKSAVLKRMNSVVREEPFNLNEDVGPGDIAQYRNWYNNSEFKVLIAALDMFWIKFPDSKLAKLRVCTLNARFKDCSSLSELKHLSSITNLNIGSALKYVFSTQIGKEMEGIGKEGEEIRQEDSYFPYMREMRLSKKSPYSSTANVNLHNWISFFCALLGSSRSFNARIVSESGLVQSVNLALFAAQAFRDRVTPNIVFGGDDEAEEAKVMHEMSVDPDNRLDIDPASPLGVYKTMLDCKNKVPKSLIDTFEQPVRALGTPRPGTIGDFLRSYIAKQ